MRGLIIAGVIVLFLILFNFIRIGVLAEYSSEGFILKLLAGPIKILLLPAKSGTKKKDTKTKKNNKNKAGSKSKKDINNKKGEDTEKQKEGGTLKLVKTVLPTAVSTLGRFLHAIRVDDLTLRYTLVRDDPCDTALFYAYISSGLGPLEPFLKKAFHIKRFQVSICPCFTESEETVYLKAQATLCIWQIIYIVLKLDFKAIFSLL